MSRKLIAKKELTKLHALEKNLDDGENGLLPEPRERSSSDGSLVHKKRISSGRSKSPHPMSREKSPSPLARTPLTYSQSFSNKLSTPSTPNKTRPHSFNTSKHKPVTRSPSTPVGKSTSTPVGNNKRKFQKNSSDKRTALLEVR